jgi:hypothetical protein
LFSNNILAVQVLLILQERPAKALSDDHDQAYFSEVYQDNISQIVLIILALEAHYIVDYKNSDANKDYKNHGHKEV